MLRLITQEPLIGSKSRSMLGLLLVAAKSAYKIKDIGSMVNDISVIVRIHRFVTLMEMKFGVKVINVQRLKLLQGYAYRRLPQ